MDDLRLLRQAGFRSLVTYGSADVLAGVPELARAAGFDGMIVMGLWDPFSKDERDKAVAQAEFVSGYCMGNEGLGLRYSPDQLGVKMADLRRLTGKPVTTSEPLLRYIAGPDKGWLVQNSDWLFPNAHPYLELGQGGVAAVDWVVSRCNYLTATSRKRLILKEVGIPTHGADCCTEGTQTEFFRLLSRVGVEFFFFEAFDQPFKLGRGTQPEVEKHWGIYRADGSAKKVVQWLVERKPPIE
jgi:exo-beta-1,3-glucanase (GH17 family)